MKNKKILIIVLSILLVFCAAEFVQAQGLYDDIQGTSGESYIDQHDNYKLDMAEISFFKAPQANMFNSIANLVFAAIKGVGMWCISAIKFALSTDIFIMVSGFIEPLFSNIHQLIFKDLSLLMISMAGFFFAIRLIKRQMMSIVTGILSLVLIIVISYTFFTYPMAILSGVNNFSEEIAENMLNAPYEATAESDLYDVDAGERSAELLWNVLVHKPWQILEFGDTEIAEQYQEQILSLPDNSEERSALIETLNKEEGLFDSSDSEQLNRVSTGLFMLIFNLIIFLVIIVIAIFIVGYQIFTVFLSLLGPFVLLLALIPIYGINFVWRWLEKIIGAIAAKILLIFGVSVLLVVMDFFYGLLDIYGIIPVLFTMVATVLIVYLKRNSIIELLTMPPAAALDSMMNVSFNPVQDVRKEVQLYNEWQERQEHKRDNDEIRTARRLEIEKLSYEKEQRQLAEQQRNLEVEDAANRTNNVYASKIYPKRDAYEENSPYTPEQWEKGLQILRENYVLSKERSEREAQETGTDVVYTPFVQRTNLLRAANPDSEFDRRDAEKMARIVQRTEAAGGSIANLRADSISSADSLQAAQQRPSNLSSDWQTEENSDDNKIKNEDVNLRGVEYFKNNFGEEKGEKFYYSLSDEYGEERIRQFSSDKKLSFSEVRRQVVAENSKIKEVDENSEVIAHDKTEN